MNRFEGCQDISLDKKNYKSNEDFKAALSTLIFTLVENDYEVLVSRDDEQYYVIRYSLNLGDPSMIASDDKAFFYATVDEIEEVAMKRHPRENCDITCDEFVGEPDGPDYKSEEAK